MNNVNPLPDNKNFPLSKLKATENNNFNLAQIVQFVFDMEGNMVGKGESAVYQHFLLYPQCFQKTSFPGSLTLSPMTN